MNELGNSASLADALTYLKRTRRTGRLTVRATISTVAPISYLLFDEGDLIDARNARDEGDDLVYRLMAAPGLIFAFAVLRRDQLPAPDQRNIDRIQAMLMLATIGALPAEAGDDAEEAPSVVPPPRSSQPLPALPDPEEVPERVRSFRRRNAIPLPPGRALVGEQPPKGTPLVTVLENLAERQFSGYALWSSDKAEGLLLLYRGQVIDAVWDDVPGMRLYNDAFAVEQMARATGKEQRYIFELHSLNADLVWAYSSIAYGSDRRTDLSLTGVDLPVLLDKLGAKQHTGCVKTVAGDQAAYIFMCRGVVLGDYKALPDELADAPGRSFDLVRQSGSLVDIYTAPAADELLTLNETRWTNQHIAIAMRRAAAEVLGDRAAEVLDVLSAAGDDPDALRAAAARARQITVLQIGRKEYVALNKRIDALLARLS